MASILIVDDKDSLRDMLTKTLTLEGYEVETAGDGNDATPSAAPTAAIQLGETRSRAKGDISPSVKRRACGVPWHGDAGDDAFVQ